MKGEIINIDGAKIFLSAKKLLKDPWMEVAGRYSLNDKVKGEILKINPFGLFVKLDEDIHALVHISSLGLKPGQKLEDLYQTGTVYEFYVISMEPREHRLGLGVSPLKEAAGKAKEIETASADTKAVVESAETDQPKKERKTKKTAKETAATAPQTSAEPATETEVAA